MRLDSIKENPMMDGSKKEISAEDRERFSKQINFIIEIDKLKHVLRQTILMDRSRRENSAEHSWHIALTVLLLSEYADDPQVDMFRVMKMLLVHDIVEIDAGDTYCYDDLGRQDQNRREERAAERIFRILPPDQAGSLRALWEEFEKRETPESKFANALDRLQPFLHNYFTEGQTWQANDIHSRQVVARMQPVEKGSSFLWEYIRALIDDAVARRILAE